MSKYYSTWKKKFKTKTGEEKVLYYACSKKGNIVDFKRLTEIISNQSTLSAADVGACLIALAENMKFMLDMGDTIRLDNIGTFSVAVSSKGFSDPKEITADKVKATKIVFKPDRDLRKVLDNFHFVSYDKKMAKYKGAISTKTTNKE
jgi:predicted histone-like DNA-binding protein